MRNYSDKIFYHIYPLGFCDALYHNDLHQAPISRIQKIDENWVRHIKSLHVNGLYLGPVFESTYHGYDTADYYHLDRRLGHDSDLTAVVDLFHRYDIQVIVDGVFNHVGRDFWAFRDVQEKGIHSPYIHWFFLDFNRKSPCGDAFYYEGWEGHYDLVKLNLHHPEVRKHLLDAVTYWVNEFHIDGIRLDVAYSLEPSFLKELSAHCKALKPDLWLLGEIIHGDYRSLANPEMLHSTTNYECYKGMYSSHNDKNYFEIAHSLQRLFGEGGLYQDLTLYNFVDNHDVNRIASTLKNPAHLYPLHTLLYTIPGIPSLYYGSEWGIEGSKSNGSDKALRPSLNLEEMGHRCSNKDLYYTLQKLGEIRSHSIALQEGNYEQLLVTNEQFVFMRRTPSETMIIALNLGDSEKEITVSVPFGHGRAIDLLNSQESFEIHGNKLALPLHPHWARVLKIES